MKTIKIYILLISLFGFSDLFSQSYLPIEPGNKWFFNHGDCSGNPVFSQCNQSIQVSNVTADSTMPNGHTYYKVDGIFFGFYGWFRSDTNWIYVYKLEDSLDLPIFNLHSAEGEIFQYGKEEYQITKFRKRDTLNIFNDKIEVLEFVLETGLDITNEFKFSNKYGFIKYDNIGFGGWSYSNLIGCVINGKSYGDVTSIEKNTNVFSSGIELYQNYPNPFNPVTTIVFTLPYSQKVEIMVYDILGNFVTTLINEFKAAGEHKVTFDAGNLTNGVCIYQIRTTHLKQSKKLILLK